MDITVIWVFALVLYGGFPATTAASPMYPHSHQPSTIRIRREPPPPGYQNSLSHGYSPSYHPPQPSYGAPPRPQYAQPAMRYGPPKQMFGAPLPRYGPPRMIYRPPMPSYGPPKSIFGPPRMNYGLPPRPSYGAPPRQSYRAPLGSYGSPSAPVGFHRLPFGSPHRVRYHHPTHHHPSGPPGGFKVSQGFAEPETFGEGHLPHANPPPDFSQSFGAPPSANAYRPQQTVSIGDKPREIDIGSSFGAQKPSNYYGSPESFNDLGEQKPASDYHVPDTSNLYGDASSSASQKPSAVIYGSAKPHREQESDSVHAPSKPFTDYRVPESNRNVNKPPSTSYGQPTGTDFLADHSSNSHGVTEAPLNTPIKSISYTLPTETFSSLNIGSSKKPGNSYKTQSNTNSKPPRNYKQQNDFSNDGIITHPNTYDSHSAASQFYNSPNAYDKPSNGYKASSDSNRNVPTSYGNQYDSYSSPTNFQNSQTKPKAPASPDFYNADSGSNYNQQQQTSQFSGAATQQNYDSFNSYQPSSNNQYTPSQSQYQHKSPYSAHPGKSTQYSHIPQSWKDASLKSVLDPNYNGPWSSNYYPPSASYDTISLSLKDDPTKTAQNNFQAYDTLSASLRDAEQNKESHVQADIQPTSGYHVATQNDAPSHQNIIVSTSSSFQAPTQTFGFQPSQQKEKQTRGEVKFPSLSDVSQEFSASNVATPHSGDDTINESSQPANVLSPNYYGSQKHYGEKLHARTPANFFGHTNEQTSSESKATQTPQTQPRIPIRNKDPSDSSRSFNVEEKVPDYVQGVLPTPVTGSSEKVR